MTGKAVVGSVLVGIVCVLMFLSGCGTVKGTIAQPTAFTSLHGELGKVTATLANGAVTQYKLPWDATWDVKNGDFRTQTTAFKIQALLGASCFQSESGLEGSPWAGVRFIHVSSLGLDFGFDKRNFSLGIDWLHHGVAVGPSAFFPYISTTSKFGLKAGMLF